ncbi:MAG: UDP-N-acetylmuramate--L-alanine ligase [Spirochaetota bacterium]
MAATPVGGGLQRIFQRTPESIAEPVRIYCIGIKGTGMCVLAQLLRHLGADVSGSDVAEHFYTDKLLQAGGIPYHEGFSRSQVPENCNLVIYSAAYDHSNPEYAEARKRQKEGKEPVQMFSYPEALSHISRYYKECLAIAGVHGKTTSTLLCSALMQGLGLESSALAGTPDLQGRAYLSQGRELLAVETCEYRNHFLRFDPGVVLLTSLEWDHQDFFTTYEMMRQSFRDFGTKESVHTLVYCADDPELCKLVAEIKNANRKPQRTLRFIPYGLSAQGDFAVARIETLAAETVLSLRAFPAFPLRLKVPGEHLALNALGALAALFYSNLVRRRYSGFADFLRREYPQICAGLENFRGGTRRSELLGTIPWGNGIETKNAASGQQGAVWVLDDYAHHPTAIRKTLAGLRQFYGPERRLVLDFMPHTYSRTINLHDEFSRCFAAADVLILHDIYASAREAEANAYNGRTLWQAVSEIRGDKVYYFPRPLEALPTLKNILLPGDLFVTMGAGNNRELALALLAEQAPC